MGAISCESNVGQLGQMLLPFPNDHVSETNLETATYTEEVKLLHGSVMHNRINYTAAII